MCVNEPDKDLNMVLDVVDPGCRGGRNAGETLKRYALAHVTLAFAVTAFCGMSMSGYAVPFLYGMAPVSFVRRMHLSMSHWAFVLMGRATARLSNAADERLDKSDVQVIL